MFKLLKKLIKLLKPIKTEENINLDYYIGKWFQVATSKSTGLLGTGIDFTSVAAKYEYIGNPSNNIISVNNSGIDDKGRFVTIDGYSFTTKNSLPTKRKVKFDNIIFAGNYWIVKLGPIKRRQYQYAIVSGPVNGLFGTRFSLYVLCRNRKNYKKKYEKEVKNWCENNGFILPWNKYIETK